MVEKMKSRRSITPDELRVSDQHRLLLGVQLWVKYKLFVVEDDPIMRQALSSIYSSMSLALLGFEEIEYILTSPQYGDSPTWKKDT